jgi:hypothetical protein
MRKRSVDFDGYHRLGRPTYHGKAVGVAAGEIVEASGGTVGSRAAAELIQRAPDEDIRALVARNDSAGRQLGGLNRP